MLALVLLSLLLLPSCICSSPDSYRESLHLKPLPDAKIATSFHFDFVSNASLSRRSYPEANVDVLYAHKFPRNLAALIHSLPINELHLVMATGRWDYERWGDPEPHGAATGTELYAWIESDRDNEDTYMNTWSTLSSSLAAMFCASLGKVSLTQTTSPSLVYHPTVQDNTANSHFFHSFVPGELPCTENLTPLTNLLPCRMSAGLAQLLNPYHVFDSNFQKLGIHVIVDREQNLINLGLEVQSVVDPVRNDLRHYGLGKRDWSFSKIFGRTITHTCPASESTKITIDLDDKDTRNINSTVASNDQYILSNSQKRIQYNLAHNDDLPHTGFDLSQSFQEEEKFEYPTTYSLATAAPIHADRILTGYGQEVGIIGIKLYNSLDKQVTVDWMETWPWWIRPYLHTLNIQTQKHSQSSSSSSSSVSSSLESFNYIPPLDRLRPCTLQSKLSLSPQSTTLITLKFDKASLLRYSEYPPDPNRGLVLPPAVISIHENNKRVYTASTIVRMPTPDFSMPYNVIILTSTLIALFFGTMFNLLTRKYVLIKA